MPLGDPNLIFIAFTCLLLRINPTLSLTISGGLIPTVSEVGVEGLGIPSRSFS